jgi:23S rRNA pseudouridine2605 synthase
MIRKTTPKAPKKTEQKAAASALMPLNKYIAQAGVCSRRKAVELVKEGLVRVNGRVELEPGYAVQPKDAVKVSGKLIAPVSPKEYVYVLLNKPAGYVTTVQDEKGRPAVVELVNLPSKPRLYPVGRLDINTTGVLLLTNDGDFAQKMSHPSFKASKVYDVKVHKALDPQDLELLKKGVRLTDGVAHVDEYFILPDQSKQKVRITLHSGKNRVIKRLFEQLRYFVEKLDRVEFCGLSKKGLARGTWRFLTKREVEKLKKM